MRHLPLGLHLAIAALTTIAAIVSANPQAIPGDKSHQHGGSNSQRGTAAFVVAGAIYQVLEPWGDQDGYLMEARLGEPPQRIKLQPNTYISDMIINPNCSNTIMTEDCERAGRYSDDLSISANRYNNTPPYFEGNRELVMGNMSGDFWQEKMDIMAPAEFQFPVFSIAKLDDSYNVLYPMLGLGWDYRSWVRFSMILQALLATRITKSTDFGISYGTRDSGAGGEPFIVFGGMDTTSFTGKVHKMAMMAPRTKVEWRVRIESISLSHASNCPEYLDPIDRHQSDVGGGGLIDSSSRFLILPEQFKEWVISRFSPELDPETGMYKIDCEHREPDFWLHFHLRDANGDEFILSSHIKAWSIDKGEDGCFLWIQGTRDNVAVLGMPFLRSVYATFSESRRAIYLAQKTNCGLYELETLSEEVAPDDVEGLCDTAPNPIPDTCDSMGAAIAGMSPSIPGSIAPDPSEKPGFDGPVSHLRLQDPDDYGTFVWLLQSRKGDSPNEDGDWVYWDKRHGYDALYTDECICSCPVPLDTSTYTSASSVTTRWESFTTMTEPIWAVHSSSSEHEEDQDTGPETSGEAEGGWGVVVTYTVVETVRTTSVVTAGETSTETSVSVTTVWAATGEEEGDMGGAEGVMITVFETVTVGV